MFGVKHQVLLAKLPLVKFDIGSSYSAFVVSIYGFGTCITT